MLNFTRFAFGATMFLAGFLLFQVQPMMAKYILPWFGGSASTWTVCMLFFQVALLLGYSYVYAASRPLSIRFQAVLQLAFVAAAIVFLPITPSAALKPQNADQPILHIITLLTISVGVPYWLLSTTSPLLQRWLSHADKGALASRYFALSNLGSFIGLLSYPFLFERLWSSEQQTQLWSKVFIGYAVLIAIITWLVWHLVARNEKDVTDEPVAPSEMERLSTILQWIGYSMLGSVLLLATTNQISLWTAVVPFLWILPLSLYLATFIIAFGYQAHYNRLWYFIAFGCLTVAAFELTSPDSSASLLEQIALQSATMFVGCMICHSEMVRMQPPSQGLPRFYMLTALGGALGGVTVTLLAPLVFGDYFEHPIVLATTGLVAALLIWKHEKAWRRNLGLGFAAVFAVAFAVTLIPLIHDEGDVIERIRNFYGVVKVIRETDENGGSAMLTMMQAGIAQGSQFEAPERRNEPYCAWRVHSGIARAIANVQKRRANPDAPLRIGSIGLGVGVLSALGKPGDSIRIYELNPAVTELAKKHFTFMADSQAKIEVVHGDGRIMLEREFADAGSQKYDVIVLDAFRGASPPIHLMTAEAFDIYLKHLTPNGVLAVNIDLDTLDISPLHRGLAEKFGLEVHWFETPDEGDDCDSAVSWALYTKDPNFFTAPGVEPGISAWPDDGVTRLLWTDANANLFSVINWRNVLNLDDN